MSPGTPPGIRRVRFGMPVQRDFVVRLRRAEIGLHVHRDHRRAMAVADAVLDDAAHVPGIDREKLARHGRLRDFRLHLVGDADRASSRAQRQSSKSTRRGRRGGSIPRSTSRVKLLGRQAGADFLLKRQPPRARILNAAHRHRLDALARHGQHDGQRVHHEPRIDAGRQARRPLPSSPCASIFLASGTLRLTG